MKGAFLRAAAAGIVAGGLLLSQSGHPVLPPGTRVVPDAHNCYPL